MGFSCGICLIGLNRMTKIDSGNGIAYIELTSTDISVAKTIEGDKYAIDLDEYDRPIGLEILDIHDLDVITRAFTGLAGMMFPEAFEE